MIYHYQNIYIFKLFKIEPSTLILHAHEALFCHAGFWHSAQSVMHHELFTVHGSRGYVTRRKTQTDRQHTVLLHIKQSEP